MHALEVYVQKIRQFDLVLDPKVNIQVTRQFHLNTGSGPHDQLCCGLQDPAYNGEGKFELSFQTRRTLKYSRKPDSEPFDIEKALRWQAAIHDVLVGKNCREGGISRKVGGGRKVASNDDYSGSEAQKTPKSEYLPESDDSPRFLSFLHHLPHFCTLVYHNLLYVYLSVIEFTIQCILL
jgi:hypothetical protein